MSDSKQDLEAGSPSFGLWHSWCRDSTTTSDDEDVLNQVVSHLSDPDMQEAAATAMAYMLTSALRSRSDPQDQREHALCAQGRLSTLLASLTSLPASEAAHVILRLHPQEALALPPPLPSTAMALAITDGWFDASLFLMRTTPCGRPIPGPCLLLALSPPTTLTALKLSSGALGNALGGPAVPWLISAIRGSPALARLDIDDLPHFTATAAAAMVRAAPALLHLRIRGLHLFNGCDALSKALAAVTALTHLDLSCTHPSANAPDAPPAATAKFSHFASLSTKTALVHVALRMMPDGHLTALLPSLPFASLVHLDITGAHKDAAPAIDSLAALLPLLPRATRLSTLLLNGHCALRRTGTPPLCKTISALPALRNLALCAVHDVPYLDGPLACISALTALSLDSLDVVSMRQLLLRSRCIEDLRLFNCGHRIEQEDECVTRQWEALHCALVEPLRAVRRVRLELLALGASGHRGVLALLGTLSSLSDMTWANSLAGATPAVAAEFAQLYGTAIGGVEGLTRLEIREQQVNTSLPLLRAVAPHLPALTRLRELKLQACEPAPQAAEEAESSARSMAGDGDAAGLMAEVAKLTALETLQLAHMAWSAPVAAAAVTGALRMLRALRWLSLRGTPIGRADAAPLAEVLGNLHHLDHLDLRGSCIGMAGSDTVWLRVRHLPLRSGVLFWGE